MSTAFTPLHRVALGSRRRTLPTRCSLRFGTALAVFALALGGCGDNPDEPVPVDKVTVEPAEAVVLVGGTVTLTPRAVDADGDPVPGAGVQWSTDNAAVATVATTGVVTGVATGVTKINASANGRNGSSIVSVAPANTQGNVPAGGGTVSTVGGEVKVTVPGGALPSGGSVTIQPVATGTAAGTTVPGTVYKVGVFGITVGPRPTITVRYSVAGLPPGFDETKLTLSRKIGVFWVVLPSQVNTVEKTITATLPAAGMVTSASTELAQASRIDEEFTVGGALYVFEADVASLTMTVGERRRVGGRVRSLASNTPAPLTSADVGSSATGIAGKSGPATVTGSEMSAEIVATAPGTASLTFSAAITSGGATESFATVIPVTVAPQASLAVTVSGLPAGVNADVTVTGPGTFSQKLTGSQSLPNVAAGTYTITAASVSSGGQTYQPAPPSQTVAIAAGESKTATVTYAGTLGSLAIAVTGLAAGTDAAITVTGPGGFSRAVTASTTLASLAAGSYTVAAANITVAGQLWTPAPSTQTVTVTAGQTANASIAYQVGVGALTVTINGLPAGVAAKVKVNGPNGFTRDLTATTTVTGLEPGAYSLVVSDVDTPNQLYTGVAAPTTSNVAAGQTAAATVSYDGTLGQLVVTVSGCGTGDVRVTGPGGFSRNVTATTTLTRLALGTYTVTTLGTAAGPPENSLICRPISAAQQVSVTNTGSAAVTSTYVQGYTLTVQSSGPGTVNVTAPNCTPASVCGVQGFYPTGTTVNVVATATAPGRVASITGVNPGACAFAPPASDLTTSRNCSLAMTTTRSLNVTFALVPTATIEKASDDPITWKQSQGSFPCCSAVRVRNLQGTPLANYAVTWTVPGNPTPLQATTDGNGVSGGIGITFGEGVTPAIGAYNLVATISIGGGQTQAVTFTYNVIAGFIAGAGNASASVVTGTVTAPARMPAGGTAPR